MVKPEAQHGTDLSDPWKAKGLPKNGDMTPWTPIVSKTAGQFLSFRGTIMRKAQISIKLELFGDQATNGHSEEIIVYADSNNVYETINAALFELLGTLQQQGHRLPSFGVREHSGGHREPMEEKKE